MASAQAVRVMSRVEATGFIVTDTLGLLLIVTVLAASAQDCDGAKAVLLDTYLRTRCGPCSPTAGSPDDCLMLRNRLTVGLRLRR